jgi:hypothetical protein
MSQLVIPPRPAFSKPLIRAPPDPGRSRRSKIRWRQYLERRTIRARHRRRKPSHGGPERERKIAADCSANLGTSGERPCDEGDGSIEEAKPVFDATGRYAGVWPPVASYPPDLASLKTPPNVSVEVLFSNPAGTQVSALRQFDGKNVAYTVDPALQIPTGLLLVPWTGS